MTGTDKWFRIRQDTVEAERLRRERRTREESLKKGTPSMGDPLEDLARMNAASDSDKRVQELERLIARVLGLQPRAWAGYDSCLLEVQKILKGEAE